VIFDCDGVLADSERAHLRAFQRVLSGEGISLTEAAYFERYLAMDDRGCLAAVIQDAGREIDPGALSDLVSHKSRAYLEEIAGGLTLIPGAADLARSLSGRFLCAIASGALRHEVEMVLEKASLAGVFQVIVTSEDVTRGKPDPESYVTALPRLNEATRPSPAIQPGECLVVEDSKHGVAAARAAGMRCRRACDAWP
jgi:HAD superfamily hydrolase (TIGR01509 family)